MKKITIIRSLGVVLLMIVGSVVANAKTALAPFGQFENQAWDAKYFYTPLWENYPGDGWFNADFDDSEWGDIQGPIGLDYSYGEALSYIATAWQENNSAYYLRRHFTVNELNNDEYILYFTFDDACTIYLNGIVLCDWWGAQSPYEYRTVRLTGEALQALKVGDNVLAAFTYDDGGGQAFFDFGLYGYNYSDILKSGDVKVAFTNDSIRPWSVEDNAAVIRGTSNYVYNSSKLKLNFTLDKDYVMSFDWASYNDGHHYGLELYVDGIYNDYISNGSTYNNKSLYLEAGEHVVTFSDSVRGYNYTYNWSAVRDIQFTDATPLVINVTEEGTLGDLILAEVSDFKDVKSIKISGKLNSDDVYTIKNLLLQALIIDIEETNITEISSEMFREHTTLQRIKLPSGITSIGDYAFIGCTALTSVTLPEGLTSMGYGVFENTGLTSIVLPSTLKVVPQYTFWNCRSLASVTFNQQEEIGRQAFRYCYALNTVTLPATMKKIQEYAFQYCHALNELTLNEGLEYIGYDAFYNCYNLTKVSLPSTLNFLGQESFWDCNAITEMTCLAIAPPFTNESNIVDREGIKLYVPELSVNVYKQRAGWTQFDIEGIDYLPENIVITESFKLTWPDDVAQTYKPNITLGRINTQGYTPDEYWNYAYYNRYGSVTVTGSSTMSANQFTMVYDPYSEWRYKWNHGSDQRMVNYTSLLNRSNARADNIAIQMTTRADYWDFLVFPFDVKISEIESDVLGGAFVIRKYDGQKRGEGLMDQTWVNMTNDSTLKAGVGYIWQSANTGKEYNNFTIHALQTTNKNNIFAKDDVKVPVNYYEAEFDHNRSWNLIGNPYPAYYDIRFMQLQAPITVWNSYNWNYEAYSPLDDAYILNPGQAFFVQAPADASSITFSADGRQNNLNVREMEAARAASNVQRSVLNIVVSGNETTDRTRVVINANAQLGYEQDKDASKFFSLNAEAVQLYSLQQGVSFSINERPLADGTVSLGAKFGQDGMYTITLDTRADCQAVLIDHLTGTETLLNGTEGYTFYAEKGTANQRFTLRIGGAGVTGIETVEGISTNGQENYFDLQGRRIAEPQKGLYIHNGKKVTVK